ncbi:MAG: hypothetical protein KGH64_00835 [Candidatus Micrarchaeota archaeon]|nr:hypothetical protein [Candidatus Micrarchaeota archaeon]MDE1833862.1 hypothetical protein [Candidatus Micrarchaeota archaeon]MDE1859349.1 hypothetical protein [Candidatus Micrarchaeota archaeon]
MPINKVLIGTALVAICALVLYLAFYKSNSSSTVSTQQRYSQQFCVNGMSNVTAMKEALNYGITCFRTDIYLNNKDTKFISNETNAGASYLGILDYNTVGAQPSGQGCVSGCNWTLADWNASVSNALTYYPEINTWEIYNEPLAGIFISGYDNGSALNYFNMIKGAYTIIKKREPNSTVVCLGGAQMFPGQSVQAEYYFYQQVWQYGASKYCDAISLHAYSLPIYSLNQTAAQTSSGNITLAQFYNFTLSLYENMTKKPVWITETGIPSNNWTHGLNLSEQNQALFLKQDFGFFTKYPYVKRIYWFNLAGSSPGGPDYGLLNGTSLQPKPALYAFLYFSRNSIS